MQQSGSLPTTLDNSVRQALQRGGLVDITTTGRRSGRPRRIEIVYHVIDGHVFISGRPNAARRRAWLANLETNPVFTFHLKRGVQADLPARARVIEDPAERRAILVHVARAWNRNDLDDMVAYSPLIEVCFD
jgi:deazaflavin-dependent oxidoreductase (nitroreductase family)